MNCEGNMDTLKGMSVSRTCRICNNDETQYLLCHFTHVLKYTKELLPLLTSVFSKTDQKKEVAKQEAKAEQLVWKPQVDPHRNPCSRRSHSCC